MSSRSFGVGNHTRTVSAEEDPFNARVLAFKGDRIDALDDDPENWPAEKVRAAAEMFQRHDQAQIAATETAKTGTAWTKLHPEYVDSDANAQLMRHQLRTNGIKKAALADFDVAYEQLKESGFLKLNQRVVRQQEEQAAKARAEAEKAQTLEDLYTMPLEDLRRLDAIENQMQRRGEEGGW